MDIFTILVFFLIFNQADVEILQNRDVDLPESFSSKQPENTVVIQVNHEDIIVQGRLVAKVDDELKSGSQTISGLRKELLFQASRKKELTEKEKQDGLAVTIMGDQTIPYKLLKKIMVTCSSSKFTQVSLAVTKKTREISGLGVTKGGSA